MAEVYFNTSGDLMMAGEAPVNISEHFRSLTRATSEEELRLECLRIAAGSRPGCPGDMLAKDAAVILAFVKGGAKTPA